jgi:uracil-DNA glycosylase family 4
MSHSENNNSHATKHTGIDAAVERFLGHRQELEIDKLFKALVKLEGSDLHLKVGRPPYVRMKGSLRPLSRGPIEDEEMVRLIFGMFDERRQNIFEQTGGADFAHVVDVDGTSWRFRVNVLQQLGHVGMVARRINNFIPDFEGLNLPPIVEELCKFDQGMILLAGVTGSGKSTTIASMLNYINHNYRKHILTLEDPIEFTFTEDKCLINQREVGTDVVDFGIGMKHAVREDPDVMLVGEMPGDEEDRQGHPFVGPAGRLLDKALAGAGIDRDDVYVTNVVKHFRWEPRGKKRLHKTPGRGHVEACRPWLQAEILAVKPQLIVCLGATAAKSLLGTDFRITKLRGEIREERRVHRRRRLAALSGQTMYGRRAFLAIRKPRLTSSTSPSNARSSCSMETNES